MSHSQGFPDFFEERVGLLLCTENEKKRLVSDLIVKFFLLLDSYKI